MALLPEYGSIAIRAGEYGEVRYARRLRAAGTSTRAGWSG